MKSIQVRILELMIKNDDKYTESPELLFKDMVELYWTLDDEQQNEMVKVFETLQSMSQKLWTDNATKWISKVLELISWKASEEDGLKIPKEILDLISELINDDEETITDTEDNNIKLLNKYLHKTNIWDLLLKRNWNAFHHWDDGSANVSGENYNTLLSLLKLHKAKITKFKPKDTEDLVNKIKDSKAFINVSAFENSDINYILMQINFIVGYIWDWKFISCYCNLDNHWYVIEKWEAVKLKTNSEYYIIN